MQNPFKSDSQAGSAAPEQETIVAVATPPGRGGIGIVRLSGPDCRQMAAPWLRLRSPLEHARARFAQIVEDGERLDEAVITFFAAPHSYTGEDLLEIAAHGSPVVLDLLVRKALAAGARLARPGEFTERAFLAGRIDLTQAEAVRDLIDAQTLFQARVAAEQMDGALSRRVRPIKESLVALIALLEAGIDFAEDDIDVAPASIILERIHSIRATLAPVAASYAQGRILRSGLTLAIVGRPNAGKSSLFNRLAERERAIVTAAPGTTRDLVTDVIAIGGIPVELVDTAGLREAADEAESIGIAKTRAAMADADAVLLVLDAAAALQEGVLRLDAEEAGLLQTLAGRPTIPVLNKLDLLPDADAAAGAALCAPFLGAAPPVATSALTGQGVDTLRARLLELLHVGGAASSGGILTSLRQHEAVQACLGALERATTAASGQIPHEMLLLDLYEALRALDELTGQTTSDDILHRIFSTFCIGK
jgi:tRNA modification GTPase